MEFTRRRAVVHPIQSLDANIVSFLKGFLDEKIVFPILILVNCNYEMSRKGVLGFSVSCFILEIFRFYDDNLHMTTSYSLTKSKLKFIKWRISEQVIGWKFLNFIHLWQLRWNLHSMDCILRILCYSCHEDRLETSVF